jgi:RND family efflux transporter MFP subunit
MRSEGEMTSIDERPPQGKRRPSRGIWVTAFVAVLLLGGLLAIGYWPRAKEARKLAAATQANQHALPIVSVVVVKQAPSEVDLALPANVQPLTEAVVFARADGYVKRRLADIGDRVKSGQLLAEVESPELDQQIREAQATLRRAQSSLRQAEAALAQSKANLGLAEATAGRWQTLVSKGVLSKQDGDEKQSALDARKADVGAAEAAVQAARDNIAANEAGVQRLSELQSFRQVRAPFAGVVTARNIDVGSLVSAGSNTSVRELFRLAQVQTLRVFVNVPQSEMTAIRTGILCSLEAEELRGKKFEGRVTRTANSLEPSSRTLLTEVQVPNPDGELLPGMYAIVHFKIHRSDPPLLIPSAAFRNTDRGPFVGLLREGATVHLQPVQLGRDFGTQIEVTAGLQAGQKVITTLTDEVREGIKVKPVAAKPAVPAGGGQSK